MKKLIPMLAVSAFATGAFAETYSSVNYFESYTPDAAMPLSGVGSEGYDDGYQVWNAGSENPTTVKAADAKRDSQYLHIETETSPLYRSFDNSSDWALGTTNLVNMGTAYVDTMVKFTAADSEPTVEPGAQFALWLQETEATDQVPGSTNLMVRCGRVGLMDVVTPTNIALNVSIVPDEWYRIQIKPILDDKTAESGIAGLGCFVVYVNETPVSAKDYSGVWATGAQDAYLNAENKAYATAGQLFPSLLSRINARSGKLAAVGFSGTGDIDDFGVDTDEPYKPTYTLTIPTVANATATVYVEDEEATELVFDRGTEVKVVWTAAAGYKITAGEEQELTITANVTAATPTVVADQTPTQIFIAAIENCEDGGTVTLTADLALDQIVNIGGKSVTIDGNYTITAANGKAFRVYNGGVLTIAAGTTVTATGTDCAIFLCPATELTSSYTQANASTATVNVYGTVIYDGTATPAAIQDNGNSIYGGAIINVYDGGVVENKKDAAIYKPGKGEINIYGGTVKGTYAGIQAKSGEINIEGGEVIATGANATPTQEYNNGAKPSGCALQLEGNGAYAGGMTVTISGGTLSSANAAALYAYGTTGKFQSVEITGGTLLAGAGQPAILNTAEAPISVSAGTFSDLSAAAYAADNATIKLANDLTVSSLSALVNDTITIDANGNLVTLTGTLALNSSVKLVNSGAMVVETVEKGFKNEAAIDIAAGKTLDLSALSWAAGVVGSDAGTASIKLEAGATYKQGLGTIWDDSITDIFSTVQDYKVKLSKDAGVATIESVAIDYATLTIATVENLTITVTNAAGQAVYTDAKFDKDDETKLYVTRTPAEGYELDGCDATEVITMSDDVEVTGAVKKATPSAPIDVPEGKTVEDVVTNATSEAEIVVNDESQITIDNVNHTVQIGNGAAVSVKPYYTVSIQTVGETKYLVYELNDTAKAEPAKVTSKDEEEIPAVAVSDTTVGVGVPTQVGLYYGLETKASLDAEDWTAPTKWVAGDGYGQALEVLKDGVQGFYRVTVTDINPNK